MSPFTHQTSSAPSNAGNHPEFWVPQAIVIVASHRRRLLRFCLCHPQWCKRITVPPEQKHPTNCRQHRRLSSGVLHCQMIRNDVHNHRPAKGNRQRQVPADQKQPSADHLRGANKPHVERNRQSSQERAPHPLQMRHGEEFQEWIQPKHKKHQSEKDSRDNRDYLHVRISSF